MQLLCRPSHGQRISCFTFASRSDRPDSLDTSAGHPCKGSTHSTRVQPVSTEQCDTPLRLSRLKCVETCEIGQSGPTWTSSPWLCHSFKALVSSSDFLEHVTTCEKRHIDPVLTSNPQCFSDISSARACSPYRLTKLQTACACMHAGADLSSKLSKLSYNGKSYPFCTASHQTTLVLQRKAFHCNGADRVVGFLHEAHTGKLRRSTEANFRRFHRFVLSHLITAVRLCDFCLHGSSRVEAQRDILNMYRRLCLQVSLKPPCEAHRKGSLHFGGGWVL